MTYDLTIERIVDAPAELVFATIVDPAAQDEIFADLVEGWAARKFAVDLRVGGTWDDRALAPMDRPIWRQGPSPRSTGPDVSPLPWRWTSWDWDWGGTIHFTESITFEGQKCKTFLTVVQSGFETEAERDALERGTAYINSLRRVVEPRRTAAGRKEHDDVGSARFPSATVPGDWPLTRLLAQGAVRGCSMGVQLRGALLYSSLRRPDNLTMAVPKTTIWPAEPHTLAKHQILRNYLGGWLPSLGSWVGKVLFIDGFCGPGEYTGGEDGSPIIALKTLLNHSYFAQLGRCEFVFPFVDEKADRIEYLETVALPKLGPLPPNVKVNTSTEKFDVVMTGILDHLAGRGARMAPAFAFVDPFGFGGVSMDLIARILEHDRSEVFITLTLDAINRFLTHRDPSINAHYDALFGDPARRDAADAADRIEAVENMYAVQLGKHANYVWSFRMSTDRGRPVYDLFFGTKHIEGLKKMKKAMWKADPVAGVRFSDRRANEIRLFEETLDTTPLQEALSKQFAGRTVSYNELEEWVLLETPYHDSHIKRRTLTPLEDQGKVEFIPPPGMTNKRAKTWWPEGCQVRFL